MKHFLSPEEREFLRIQHKKERDKRICYRINAVLLADIGWSYRQIAELLTRLLQIYREEEPILQTNY